MELRMNLIHKPENLDLPTCVVEDVVVLSDKQFDALLFAPLKRWAFIAERTRTMWDDGEIYHCLLALSAGRQDGVLIEAEGYDYVRNGAYVTGARMLLEAELAHAADLIVRDGLENAQEGDSGFSLSRLRQETGLAVTESNGIGAMLLDALSHRPEVAAVVLEAGHVRTVFHPEFCKTLSEGEICHDDTQHQQTM